MRRKIKEKRTITPDETYDSIKVSKLINYVMERGKKNASRRVVYDAMVSVKDKAKVDNPLEIFEMALKNTAPNMEVKSRRVGGANYQVPIEVRPERKQDEVALAVAKGFAEGSATMATKTEMHELKEEVGKISDKIDRVEYLVNGHDRRIDVLEDKVRRISVKIGGIGR